MQWYLNEVSLQGQYTHRSGDFIEEIKQLLFILDENKNFSDNFFVLNSIGESHVEEDITFRELLYKITDPKLKVFKKRVFSLISKMKSKKNPMNDEKIDGERIRYRTEDVTNTAIGSAVRNIRDGKQSSLYSFAGGEKLDFELSQIPIDYSATDVPSEIHNVENFWDIKILEGHLKSIRPRESWSDLFNAVSENLTNLEINKNCLLKMHNQPFDLTVFENIYTLLKYLNDYMYNLRNDNIDIANKIIDDHISNEKKFSNESETNRNDKIFRKRMTFPSMHGNSVFAPYHGKVNKGSMKYRLHYDWPVKQGRDKIEIFYIGPKLTK